MSEDHPHYGKMKAGEVFDLAERGDKGAQDAVNRLDNLSNKFGDSRAKLGPPPDGIGEIIRHVREAEARRKAEAIAREEAMVDELAAMRRISFASSRTTRNRLSRR